MSLYILDTDTVSLFQHGHAVVCAAVAEHAQDRTTINVLTVEEQLSGWYAELRRAKTAPVLAGIYQRMADTVQFYSGLPIVAFSEAAITRYEKLRRLKLNVKKIDLRIAAITLVENGILVTRNVRDFAQVPGLQIEDWSK